MDRESKLFSIECCIVRPSPPSESRKNLVILSRNFVKASLVIFLQALFSKMGAAGLKITKIRSGSHSDAKIEDIPSESA